MSILLSVVCIAVAQAGDPSDFLVLSKSGKCSDAKRREQELKAEVSQQPNTPIISTKRTYRGDQASLFYFCAANDRIVRRQVIMQFADPSDAESAFNRHTSAIIEELGHPCVAIAKSKADSTEARSSGVDRPSPQTQRTVVWNINAEYNAILFFYPGTSSKRWQIQLVFNSLADAKVSEESENIWRAHGCNLPIVKEPDPNSAQFTLFIP